MEFRTEKTISAILMLGFVAWGNSSGAEVRHQHVRKGAMGQIEIGENSISFKEAGKKSEHSWQWKYEDIQQLTLSPTELRILSYDDEKGQFGRDREYVFDQLPKDFAAQVCPLLRERLDQRFTQLFNTSTSLGRLTLNILLSFAQFERELIGARQDVGGTEEGKVDRRLSATRL